MGQFLSEYYLTLKALHIIFVISWMAGLLYLPRLFVYHTKVKSGSETCEMFKVMEYRLLKYIMNPAMIGSFFFGGLLIVVLIENEMFTGWMHVKLLLVFVMAFSHGMMAKYRKAFEAGENRKSTVFYKVFNEIPTVMMVAIVFLAILKPF